MNRLQADCGISTWGRKRPRNFRLALLIIDGLLLAFFVGATFLDDAPWLIGLDLAIAGLLSADVLARLWIADFRPRAFLRAHL